MSEATVVDSRVADERLEHLRKMLDTAPYPNDDSRDICKMLTELQALRLSATAAESRIKELETESAKHYSMAVAMFYSGKVDNLTGPDCRKAAKTIEAMLAAEAVEYPKCQSCGGRAGHWSDCEKFPS